ncbi:hypothetical protein AMTRI_Chr13g88150 [Amborella trichopoda]
MNALGREVKKFIIKRKDSDAGEAGRALEEVRASLFNDVRTSEGAKLQQQRFFGPFVALSFNFLIAVGIIMVNKLVLGSRVGFDFPIFLTFIHYACSWFLMTVFNAFSLLPPSPPSKFSSTRAPFSSLFALGAVMSLSNGLANVSLKHNSGLQGLALTVVSIGVAVATVTDLQFNFFGACIAMAWIIPSAINKILWSNLQQQENWTALALMWKTTPVTLLFLLALMPSLDPPGVLSFNWDFSNTSAILISAALGFLLQWSGALALGATSATTHVVLGQFKTCIILLGGSLLFQSDPGVMSICGAVGALCGMSVYTYLNLQKTTDAMTEAESV